MSETKTETPLEHFGAWTRTAEADGIGKGGTVLANDLIDLYEIVGSEYCRAQGLDFNDDVYHGDHEGIIQWACCTAEDIDSYKSMKRLEDEIRQLVQQDIDNLEHDPREESDEDSDEAE